VPVAAEFPDEVPRDLPQLDVTLDEEVATVTDLDGSSPLEASGPSRKGSGGGCSARSAESPLGPAVPVAFLVVSLIGWSRVRRRENSR
jgi:hypothetical protein